MTLHEQYNLLITISMCRVRFFPSVELLSGWEHHHGLRPHLGQKAERGGLVLSWSLKHLTVLMRGTVRALCVKLTETIDSVRGHWATCCYWSCATRSRRYHIYCAAAWRVVGGAADWHREGVRCGERWREQAFQLRSNNKIQSCCITVPVSSISALHKPPPSFEMKLSRSLPLLRLFATD